MVLDQRDRPPLRPRGGRNWRAVAIVAVVLAIVILILHRMDPTVLSGEQGYGRLIWLAMVFVLVAPAAFAGRLSRNLRNLLIWGGIFVGVIAAATFWEQRQGAETSFRAELMPQHDGADTPGIARFRANASGEFVAQGAVNGVPIRFLIDTGATDVVLTLEDAERIGFVPEDMVFSRLYQTANGTVKGAPVRLSRVSVGGVALDAVRASVNSADMNQSLLGMSFLNRLSGFEVRDGTLTLRQ